MSLGVARCVQYVLVRTGGFRHLVTVTWGTLTGPWSSIGKGICVSGHILFFLFFYFILYTGKYNLAHGQYSLSTSYILRDLHK